MSKSTTETEPSIMKLYNVFNGQLHSAKVVRETPLFYFLENYRTAFGSAKRISKEDAHLTPMEAIQYALNNSRKMLGAFEDKVTLYQEEIKTILYLQKAYNDK